MANEVVYNKAKTNFANGVLDFGAIEAVEESYFSVRPSVVPI